MQSTDVTEFKILIVTFQIRCFISILLFGLNFNKLVNIILHVEILTIQHGEATTVLAIGILVSSREEGHLGRCPALAEQGFALAVQLAFNRLACVGLALYRQAL